MLSVLEKYELCLYITRNDYDHMNIPWLFLKKGMLKYTGKKMLDIGAINEVLGRKGPGYASEIIDVV